MAKEKEIVSDPVQHKHLSPNKRVGFNPTELQQRAQTWDNRLVGILEP